MGLFAKLVERISDNPFLFILCRRILENDFKAIRALIRRDLRLGQGLRTLDLGCGPGAFADVFAGRPVRRRRPERALHRARAAEVPGHVRGGRRAQARPARPPRSTRCSSSACCTISPTTTRARSWARCAGCSCPADALLVIEDIPAISKLNLIGHLIHNVENGEHIRPTEDYRRLYAEAARVEREEVLQSGICDYYAAVLVTPSS